MKPRLTEAERAAHFFRKTVYQAMRDLFVTGEAEDAEKQHAREWLFSDSKGYGSFLWNCDAGGLDPDEVRREVRARGIG